jgi:hypothetical protein
VGAFLLAALITGCSHQPDRGAPDRPQAPVAASGPIRYHNAAQEAGITYRLGHKSLAKLNILDTIGHGCAFLDYDGDGKLDILLVGFDHCLLYRNQGNGKFEDVTDRAFPGAPRKPYLLGCAVADYDGDGRPDIFVSGYGRTILYHNEGNGTFKDVTAGSGLEARGPYDWTTSAAWADLEGKGRLSLFVGRYVYFNGSNPPLCPYGGLDGSHIMMGCGPQKYRPEHGSLYRYDGGNRFTDVTTQYGLDAAHGKVLGCMFADIGDGHPSLYLSNDSIAGDLFIAKSGGRYTNRAVEAGVGFSADGNMPAGMGVDWGDYDGDGRFDLVVADYAGTPKSLYHNEGNASFAQTTYATGISAETVKPLAFSMAFVDADNDGWPDLAVTNGHVLAEIDKTDRGQSFPQPSQILRNVGGRFEDVSSGAGPDITRPIVGRGLAVGDYDGDGREDLLIVDDEGAPLLLHNDSPPGNHWISLRSERRPGGSPAVGALVTLVASGRNRIAEERASGSYLSSNAPGVHFGLGTTDKIDEIRIRWPDGHNTRISGPPVDHAYHVAPGDTSLHADR